VTEPEGGAGATVPPPPPWAAPAAPAPQTEPESPDAAAPAVPPAAGDATPAASATQQGSTAGTLGSGGTVTLSVSSGGPPLRTAPAQAVSQVSTQAGKRSKRPLLIVAVALGLVCVAAVVLAVIPRGSGSAATSPVEGQLTQVGDDQPPPPDETQPTSPPSTAPPTTQALPPAQVVNHITTTDNVVFITIDDGWHVPPEARAQLMSGTLPITTFLLDQVLQKDPELWKGLDQAAGSVENHSISHPAFAKLSLEQQQEQICKTSEDIAARIGHFPTMFRPPYGSTNANTAVAAGNCGIKYIVMWGASVNGGKVTFASGDALRRGDIVLLHYRPELAGDLAAVLAAAEYAGLKPARLTDYLT